MDLDQLGIPHVFNTFLKLEFWMAGIIANSQSKAMLQYRF